MLTNVKIRKAAITAVAAVTLAAMAAAPAHAWGKNEQNFLKGAAATAIIGAIILNAQKTRVAPQAQRQQQYQEFPRTQAPRPIYQEPVYQEPVYQQPVYQQPVRYQPTYQPSVQHTPAARAFNSYTAVERRQIQARLADWGYYRGRIDGAFGPATYRAIEAYADDSQTADKLSTVGGAYGLYEQLIS